MVAPQDARQHEQIPLATASSTFPFSALLCYGQADTKPLSFHLISRRLSGFVEPARLPFTFSEEPLGIPPLAPCAVLAKLESFLSAISLDRSLLLDALAGVYRLHL